MKPAISGDMIASIDVTEHGSGFDVSALATTAVKDGIVYVINGSKTYVYHIVKKLNTFFT